jgi:hypothetical protein
VVAAVPGPVVAVPSFLYLRLTFDEVSMRYFNIYKAMYFPFVSVHELFQRPWYDYQGNVYGAKPILLRMLICASYAGRRLTLDLCQVLQVLKLKILN